MRVAILPLLLATCLLLMVAYGSAAKVPGVLHDLNRGSSPPDGGPTWWASGAAWTPGPTSRINTHDEAREWFPVDEPQARHAVPRASQWQDDITLRSHGECIVDGSSHPSVDSPDLMQELLRIGATTGLASRLLVLNVDRDASWRQVARLIHALDVQTMSAFRVSFWPLGSSRLFRFTARPERDGEELPSPQHRAELLATWAKGRVSVEVKPHVEIRIGEHEIWLPLLDDSSRTGLILHDTPDRLEEQNEAWDQVAAALWDLPGTTPGSAAFAIDVGEEVPTGVVVTLLDLLIDVQRTEGIVFPSDGLVIDLQPPSTPGSNSGLHFVGAHEPVEAISVLVALALGGLMMMGTIVSASSVRGSRRLGLRATALAGTD